MFAFPNTTLLGKAGRQAVGHPGLKGQSQPASTGLLLPQQQGGPNYPLLPRVQRPQETRCPGGGFGGCSWGPQPGPDSTTHPAGATSQLPSPGPESCDLVDTPELSKGCLELCPFALPGVVGMHTGGARKGSAGVQEGQLLGEVVGYQDLSLSRERK